jgi:hypothetical protein
MGPARLWDHLGSMRDVPPIPTVSARLPRIRSSPSSESGARELGVQLRNQVVAADTGPGGPGRLQVADALLVGAQAGQSPVRRTDGVRRPDRGVEDRAAS